MRRIALACTVAVALSAVAGCASTGIRDYWASPTASKPLGFEKVIVVFMDERESTRRAGENALAVRIGRDRAFASYLMFTGEQVQNAEQHQDAIRERVQAEGFDGAVVMRLVDEKEQLSYSPGMAYPTRYGGFYGFYGYGWGMAYSPGYMSTSTIVSVETNVYDLRSDELVFSGLTDTTNPSQIEGMVNEIADAVASKLRSEGLIR